MWHKSHENSHEGGASTASYWKSHHPGKNDPHEELPVDVSGSVVANKDYRPDFTVGRAYGQSQVRGEENGERRTQLDCETTGIEREHACLERKQTDLEDRLIRRLRLF